MAREEAPAQSSPPHACSGGSAQAASPAQRTESAAPSQPTPSPRLESARSSLISAAPAIDPISLPSAADSAQAAPIAGGKPAAESLRRGPDATAPPRRHDSTARPIMDESTGPEASKTPETPDRPNPLPPPHPPSPPVATRAMAHPHPSHAWQSVTPCSLGPRLGPRPVSASQPILRRSAHTIASSRVCTSSLAASAAPMASLDGRTSWAAPSLTLTSSRAAPPMIYDGRRCLSAGALGFGVPNATSRSDSVQIRNRARSDSVQISDFRSQSGAGRCDQVIRENPASRGTETSAEVLVGPPWRMEGWCRTPVNSRVVYYFRIRGGYPCNANSVSDQVIRENPASRGTETSAEVLVGPPWRMEGWCRTPVNSRVVYYFRIRGGYPCNANSVSDQVIRENPASRGTETSAEVLVGPPWRMEGWCRTPVNSRVVYYFRIRGGYPCNANSVSDQVIRENPASRGTETSAEVLVGPPWRMEGWCRTPVNSRVVYYFRIRGGYPCNANSVSDQVIRENPASRGTETSAQ